ncbi:uncharacterized protein [Haliotis asinina]|uniref:uncharacterized protein n=1 Tax=Haliotis asinina TaxID=109174 RepID=UPI0035325944
MYALVFCLFVSSAVGLPNYHGKIRSDTEFVAIRHLHSDHDEVERDTPRMPRRIVLEVELSHGRVVFNLTRSERDHHEIPVLVHQGGKVIHKDVQENYDQAVYKDQRLNAALMVERIETDKYKAAGVFNIGETPYNIWPEKRHRRSALNTTEAHAVSILFHIDFRGDAELNDVYWSRKDEFDRQMALLKGFKASFGRQKRSNVQQHTVELCFFSDNADWTRFLTEAGGNPTVAESNLRLFYAHLVEAMNVRYANLPVDQVCIQVVIKGLNIFMMANTPSWIFDFVSPAGTVNASAAIRQMSGETPGTTARAADQNMGRPCDHFMLFTGRNLFGSSEASMMVDISGIALQGAMCSPLSVSIVENDRDGSVCLVASHELGHSLNAQHDVDAGCDDANGFIMATRFSSPSAASPGNFFRFSTCSSATFQAFFNTLNARNNNCALVMNVPGGPVLDTGGTIAGQRTDADAQCARFMPGTRFCRILAVFLGLDTMCQTIGCSANTGPGDRCEFLVPLDRTSCGDRRWCVQGQCVTNNAAPARPANCPQGDDPAIGCTTALCASEPFRCCQTCQTTPTPVISTTASTTTPAATTVSTTPAATAAPTTPAATAAPTTPAATAAPTTPAATAAPTTPAATAAPTTPAATAAPTTPAATAATAAPTTPPATTASTTSVTTAAPTTSSTTVETTTTTSITTVSFTISAGTQPSVENVFLLSC